MVGQCTRAPRALLRDPTQDPRWLTSPEGARSKGPFPADVLATECHQAYVDPEIGREMLVEVEFISQCPSRYRCEVATAQVAV